ncbi:Phage Mu protein F like protein [compost metagenome]
MALTRAQKTAVAKTLDFLRVARVDVRERRVVDRLEILAKQNYDEVAYIARIGLAAKAAKVLNRIGTAVREGRLEASLGDKEKLREIAGEAMTDAEADLILRNSFATAYNAGRQEQQKGDRTRPYLLYRTMGDGAVRPGHAKLDGVLLPKDHEFWETHYPPNGHNCRCRVDGVTVKQAEALVEAEGSRVRTKPPRERQVAYIDTVTGKRLTTPESVDPGWVGSPSSDPQRFAKHLERSLQRLEQEAV